jgi:hypothetical protein
MSSLMTNIKITDVVSVHINNQALTVELADGRTVSLPISWYPRLYHATDEERQNFRIMGSGSGIHEADISIEGIIAGYRSQES